MKMKNLLMLIVALVFSGYAISQVTSTITQERPTEEQLHGPTVTVPYVPSENKATGDDCSDPIIITLPADFPYMDANQTTCGRVNDYEATCLGYFDGGEDIIYRLDVTADVAVNITLDPKGTTYTGICIDDECPPADPCMDYSTAYGASIHGFTNMVLTAAGSPYYIMIDTWPSPTCIPDFDLTITQYSVIPGTDCANPISVTLPASLPYTDANQTTCGLIDDYDATCLGSYDGGEDIIYELTVTTDVTVDITLDPGSSMYTGICIDNFCPPADPCIDFSTSNAATPHGLTSVTLTAAVGTYYIMIDTWPSPTCITDFDLTIITTPLPPANDDCANAEVIGEVTDQPFSTNQATASGNNPGCGGSTDPIDIWYVYTATADGALSVDLCDSPFDTRIGIWDDCPGNGGTVIICGDDDCANDPEVEIPVTTGTSYYIQVGGFNATIGNGDITTLLITCFAPTAQTETNITPTGADVGWSSVDSFFDIYFVIENDPPPTPGTTPTVNDNPGNSYTWTGGNPNTTYDWYVRTDCGQNNTDVSTWTGPSTFTTECGIYPTSYSENFNGTYLPDCWYEAWGDPPNPTQQGSAWVKSTNFANAPGNTPGVKMNVYSTDKDWLVSPEIDLGNGNRQVKFKVAATGWNNTNPVTMSADDKVYVLITSSTKATWDLTDAITIYTNTNSPSNTGDDEVFALTGWTGTVRFAFFTDGTGTSPDMDIHFDDFVVEGITTTWTGTAKSYDWHTAANWTNGVPGPGTDVTIPTGCANYPTISAAAACNDIILGSDASGTATLVDDGYLTVNGTATVQRYYPTGAPTLDEWHLISAPISDGQSSIYTGFYLQWYEEGNITWHDVVPVTDPLTSLQGFAFYAPNDGMTFDYVGNLGDGTYNIPISAFGPDNWHWNLFGNPYPSALDWDLVAPVNSANMQNGAVYYLDQATGAYVSYNGGMGGGVRYVPPGQGFFITGAIDLSLFTVDNSMRTHTGGSAYYKTEFDNLLVLEAEGNDFTDAAYLRFDEEATAGIDKQFDAYKLFTASNPQLPQIYTVGGDKLSINVLPETEMVPAGFKAGTSGIYTINIKEVTGMANVILEDLINGTQTDLMSNPYIFNYNVDDQENRFIVHFTPLAVPETFEEMVNIFSFNTDVYVTVPVNTEGNIFIYNMMGQEVASKRIDDVQNIITLERSSYYVVKVLSDESLVTKKVFIK